MCPRLTASRHKLLLLNVWLRSLPSHPITRLKGYEIHIEKSEVIGLSSVPRVGRYRSQRCACTSRSTLLAPVSICQAEFATLITSQSYRTANSIGYAAAAKSKSATQAALQSRHCKAVHSLIPRLPHRRVQSLFFVPSLSCRDIRQVCSR